MSRYVIVVFDLLVANVAGVLLICPCFRHTMLVLITRLVVASRCLWLDRMSASRFADEAWMCGLGRIVVGMDVATLSAVLLMLLRGDGGCSEECKCEGGSEACGSTGIQLGLVMIK